MRIFDREQPWPDKVNFVDENNVCLGYELNQSCCENAGWALVATERWLTDDEMCTEFKESRSRVLEGYIFDKDYFDKDYIMRTDASDCNSDENYGGGGAVRFRLVDAEGAQKPIYLILWNRHNGYYGHGFTFSLPWEEHDEHDEDDPIPPKPESLTGGTL